MNDVRVPGKNFLAPIFACVALVLVHVFVGDHATFTQRMFGALLGCIAICAAWRYWSLRLFGRLPVAELAAVQMYIGFGVHTITNSLRRGPQVAPDATTTALIACTTFIGLALAASKLGAAAGGRVRSRIAELLPRRILARRTWLFGPWVALCALANAGLDWRVPMALRFPFSLVFGMSGVLVYIALCGLHEEDGSRREPTVIRRQLFLAAAIIGGAGLLSGMLEQVLRPLVVALVLVLLVQRRFPATWLAIGMLLFILLNPAKHAFRANQGWGDIDKNDVSSRRDEVLGPAEAIDVWWEALDSTWSGDDVTRTTETTLDRLNSLSGVARTIEFAGRRVPFDRGSRWHLIPLSFIPRLLDPEKPVMTREFNDRYNYLFGLQSSESTRSTTVALPLISDGYWNFGWPGILFVAVVAGLYWGLVGSLWGEDCWGLCWLAIALFVRTSVSTPLYSHLGGLPAIVVGISAAAWGVSLVAGFFGARSEARGRSNAALRR